MLNNVKFAGMIGAALLLGIFVFSSFFTVKQNELTVVNRFGEFVMLPDPGCISKCR
jgi:regulator of protease activity HflC (stomatin/prohibitin superfamily)